MMTWEQRGERSYRINLNGHPTKEHEEMYERAAAWCMDQFDKKDWTRFRFGTWRIDFRNDADAIAFKLRWC